MQVVVNGILTNYQSVGDGKKVLVILHGWQRSLVEWMPVAKLFADKYRVISLDLPGFGTSHLPQTSWDTYEYAHFVTDFLHKLDIQTYSLLGHSFGGRLGIILAAETDNIEQLVLVDSAGIETKTLPTQIKLVAAKAIRPLLPRKIRNRLQAILGSDDYNTSGALQETFTKVVSQDLTHLFGQIKVPTAVIWGEHDGQLPLWHTRIIKKHIPQAVVRIIWEAGHDPHLEKPQEFQTVLEEIL